jgi:hypothetical protein
MVGRIMEADLGMPIAYRSGERIVTSPASGETIVADGVYVLMGQNDQEGCKTRLRDLLAA